MVVKKINISRANFLGKRIMFSCLELQAKETGPRETFCYKPHKHTHTHIPYNNKMYSVVFPFTSIIFRLFPQQKQDTKVLRES